jgi:hypothetical protein
MNKLFLALIFVTASASADCVFGKDMVQMARFRDLKVSKQITLTPTSKLTPLQVEQIMAGAKVMEFEDAANASEVIKDLDDSELWIRRVWDSAHRVAYQFYIYSLGDNIQGFITEEKSAKIVAKVGDASFYECEPQFDNYDSLPWFYSN